jgi:hypothetical protein
MKINNRIYQKKQVNRGSGIPIINKAPQRAPKQYSRPKPIDLSGTKETKKVIYRKYRNQGTIQTTIEIRRNPRGRGQTRNSSRERRLSRLYNKKNGLKIALI